MADIKIFNPDNMGKPLGQYSNVARVKASEFLFIAGQVGNDQAGKTAADFDAQCAHVFANIDAALKAWARAGGTWSSSRPILCTRKIFQSS